MLYLLPGNSFALALKSYVKNINPFSTNVPLIYVIVDFYLENI